MVKSISIISIFLIYTSHIKIPIMLYNDLDKIPLDIFIDVFLGEKRKLIIDGNHSEEELESQASMLISEYIEIVGGASVSSEILKRVI